MKKLKGIVKFSGLAFLAAAVLSGCQFLFGPAAATGTLGIGVEALSAKTIMPSSAPAPASYIARLTRSGYAEISSYSTASPITVSGIPLGGWNLVVEAYKDLRTSEGGDPSQLLGKSSSRAVTITGATGGDSVSVAILAGALGSGRLEVSYDWSVAKSLVDSASAVVTRLSDETKAITLAAGESWQGEGVYTSVAEGKASIYASLPSADADPYVLKLRLKKNGADHVPFEELAYVFDYQTSAKIVTIAAEDLSSPPAAPTGFAMAMPASARIGLTWTDVSNTEDGFNVYRKSDEGALAKIGTAAKYATSYDDIGVPDAATTTYEVRSYNRFGESAGLGATAKRVTGLSLDQGALTLGAIGNATLAATVLPTDANFKSLTWASGDATVATVVADGSDPLKAIVQAKKAGSTTITATSLDGSKTASCEVTVTKGSLLININLDAPTQPTIDFGGKAAALNKVLSEEMTVVATAGFASYAWSIDGGAIANGAEPNKITLKSADLSVGSHSVHLVVTDAKGRSYSASFSFDVKNERQGNLLVNISYSNAPGEPVFALSGHVAKLEKSASETMTVNAAEALGTYAWYLDGSQTYPDASAIAGQATRSLAIASAKLAVGRHVLMLEVVKDGVRDSTSLAFDVQYLGTVGTIAGTVRDIISGNPVAGAIAIARYGALEYQTVSDASGNYSLSNVAVGSGTVTFTDAAHLSAVYQNIEVASGASTQLEALLQIPNAYSSGTGTAAGAIKNAFTGAVVDGVTLELRPGLNNRDGATVTATTTTAGDGSYSFAGLSPGHYTAALRKSSFITTYFTVIALGGGTTRANQNSVISPLLADGEVRIVLAWGGQPLDLDMFLDVPKNAYTERLNYNFKTVKNASGTTLAKLDCDVTAGYGPETVTIVPPQASGTFALYVHDWEWNSASPSEKRLAKSGAVVRVYKGASGSSALWKELPVPNQEGDLWSVLTLDGGTLSAVNTISASSFGIVTYWKGGDSVQDTFVKSSSLLLRERSALEGVNASFAVPAGKRFKGWATTSGGAVVYTDGQKIATGVADFNLYAVFADLFALGYDGNGNSGGTAPAGGSYESGENAILSGNTGLLTKAGFYFDGWNTAADGSGTGYAAGASFAMPGTVTTLYAKWTVNP